MSETMNPNYDSDKLEWETFEVEYGEPCWSFNTLKFWKTKDGLIYSAHDSGCSCPTPFEDYEGETEAEIIQKLERVPNLIEAKRIYESHGVEDYSKPDKPWDEVHRALEAWGLR
jgi:hypothetical protein